MVDKTTDTQSVLDALVRGVTDRKPGLPLTPIAQEKTGPAYAGESKAPFFEPASAELVAYLHTIADTAMMILSVVDRVEKELTQAALEGRTPSRVSYAKVAPEAEPERLTEKQKVEAEESFEESFARKQAEAQAAVFTHTDAKAEGLWLCPVHGSAVEATSKKGRKYRRCEACSEFERV